MDLTSDHPFWFIRNGLLQTYPPLEQDETCDVAVIGAGITGAIIAHRLTKMGLSVVVVDRRDVCLGSTSASTSLLQYEIDLPLVEMAKKIGKEAASRAYWLSYESVNSLAELAESLTIDCGFERKTSLYLASDKKRRHCWRTKQKLAEPAESTFACSAPRNFTTSSM